MGGGGGAIMGKTRKRSEMTLRSNGENIPADPVLQSPTRALALTSESSDLNNSCRTPTPPCNREVPTDAFTEA